MHNNGHRPGFPQALKRPVTADSPPLPTDFARHFNHHVIPRLHRGAQYLAPFVARRDVSFAEALDALASLAVTHGAADLSDLNSLLDGLATVLSDCCDEARERQP